MASKSDAIMKQVKKESKKFIKETEDAERLTYFLKDAGQPVIEQVGIVNEMKAQSKKLKKALKNDQQYYG